MEIVVGKDLFAEIIEFLKVNNKRNIYIITDENVANYHLENLLSFLSSYNVRVYVLEPGEKSKSLEVISGIYLELIENNYDRSTTIISLGGGDRKSVV